MSDFAIFVMLAILAVPAVAIVWIFKKIKGPRDKGKHDDYSNSFLGRLGEPDFAAIENHFGVELPSALKDFYECEMVMGHCDLEINGEEWAIAFFEPLDADSLRESWPGCERFVSIANDGCGNEYVFDPQAEHQPLLFHDHETGELAEVTQSLDAFLEHVSTVIHRNRQANKS